MLGPTWISWQEVNISLEDMCDVDDHKSQSLYHFAMNGKSFGVIEEHFPDMLQKVRVRWRKDT